ncbi:MAG: sodium:solute symporter [Clostridiales Family XIII bacterium]|jgi:SSS family solute:Na+ symporter/sodium/proline symporter|nr:sodium:solute symporter [Clostridiales Family XIII bacterium]
MIQTIAIISILVYTAVCIIVGVRSMRHSSTVEGFLLGGRKMGPWLSAFSYGTSYFSAVIFVGYAGMFGWMIGLGSMWIGIGNAVIGCLIAWKLIASPTRRMTRRLGSRTMPEFFSSRYLSRGMKIYAALIIFIFLVPYAASVYKGLGSIFSAIFVGADPVICMAIVAVLTAVYLVLGGYIATAYNDLIQGLIMIVGLVLMVIILVNQPEIGGFTQVVRRLSAIDPQLTKLTGGSFVKLLSINILLTSFGVWGMPQMISKYYAIKDESSIKQATIVSTVFALIIGVGAYFTGSLSRLLLPATAEGMPDVAGGYDGVIPTLLMEKLSANIFSIIVLCVILLLLLSASMSTLSAVVLSSASAISIDLIQEVHPKISQKRQMIIMRALCILFVLFSFLFASLGISFIVNLMSFSWGVVAGSFIGPFIWGIYNKGITKIGAWCGLLSGPVVVGTLLIYNVVQSGFDVAKGFAPQFGVTAMGISLVIVPLVSLITKKYSAAHLTHVFAAEETKVG